MTTLAVEVTSRCNRRCVYCYNEWRKSSEGEVERPELPVEDLVALVAKVVAEGGGTSVQVTGGEPLLRPDLLPFLGGIRRLGVRASLTTDGGLMDAAMARALARLGVGPVQPTILAADRDLHDELKGVRGAFDATIRGIRQLVDAHVPVTIAFVSTSRTWDRLQEVVELAMALGVRHVAFNRLCARGSAAQHLEALMPTVAMVRHGLDIAMWARSRLGIAVHVAISLPWCVATDAHRGALPLGRCALGSSAPGYTIGSDGTVRPCSISPSVLGDLTTEPWEVIEARASDEYLPALLDLPPECCSCALVDECGGGCRESALATTGAPGGHDPLALPHEDEHPSISG